MAVWESDVQNYLGFPDGISGPALLEKGRAQATRFGVDIIDDEAKRLAKEEDFFRVEGRAGHCDAKRVLLATGLTHLPPDIPGVRECLGRSLFFCKDCDALRVKGKRVVIIGSNNDSVEYALSMLAYSPCVMVATNAKEVRWDVRHQAWLEEYEVVVRQDRIVDVEHQDGQIATLHFERGPRIPTEALFTTKGDVYHTSLAECVGAELDEEGQIKIDHSMHTSVPGLYAAGCVTPANCQMIIAAGQGATAAQAIHRDLFEESLQRHALPVVGPRFSEPVCHREPE
jgi:thioredoxin reductase (NADPH)